MGRPLGNAVAFLRFVPMVILGSGRAVDGICDGVFSDRTRIRGAVLPVCRVVIGDECRRGNGIFIVVFVEDMGIDIAVAGRRGSDVRYTEAQWV